VRVDRILLQVFRVGRTHRHPLRVALALLLLGRLVSVDPAGAELPAGAIAFVHEDSGSTDPLQQIFNLRLLDARSPATQVVLTAFALAPTLVESPVWSRDFSVVAFASNAGNGLRSLEEESIYAVDVDGSDLRPLTGFGLLADLPGPTGVVAGRVVAPTLVIGNRTVVPTVSACIVSAQGASVTAACENDGSFRLAGVPVGSAWVRAQADVTYFDAVLGLYGGPGLSFGFATIDVAAGQTTHAGDVRIAPAIEKSIYPSFAPGDSRLLASDRVRAMVLRQNPYSFAWEWVPTRGGTLVVWDLTGATGPTPIVLPGPADVADLSGGDWSPVAERIACAANGTIGGQGGSFVLLVDPDGTDPDPIYQSSLGPFDPIRLVLQARWSPDGGRLAVVESATDVYDPSRGRSDVFVMNADGSDVHAVTTSAWGEYAGSPSWAPDGQTLAYHVAIMPSLFTMIVERSDLFAVRADGSGRVQLTTDGRSSQPAWRSGGLPPLPPPCDDPGDCDDGDPCTTDACNGGACVSQPIGGFDGARCVIGGLGGALCDPGTVDAKLERFLVRQVGRATRALDRAETATSAKRRGKQLRAATARLGAIARRVTKLVRKRKTPLDGACRDRILGRVTAAQGVVAGLGG
jgi:hypothetical protein